MSSSVSSSPSSHMLSPLLAAVNSSSPTSALNERIKLQRGMHLTPPEATRGSFSSGKVSDHSSPSPSPVFSDAEDLALALSLDTPTSSSRAGNTTQAVSSRQLLLTLHSRALYASNESLAVSAEKVRFIPLPNQSEELRNSAQSPKPTHFTFS